LELSAALFACLFPEYHCRCVIARRASRSSRNILRKTRPNLVYFPEYHCRCVLARRSPSQDELAPSLVALRGLREISYAKPDLILSISRIPLSLRHRSSLAIARCARTIARRSPSQDELDPHSSHASVSEKILS